MRRRHRGRWLIVGAVLCTLAVLGALAGAGQVAGSPAASAADPTVSCAVSERYPEPDERVTISAVDTTDADSFAYDVDGDGTLESDRTGQRFYETSYAEGTYQPTVTAYNETNGTQATAPCPEVVVAPNDPPDAALTYRPDAPTVGESVTFDATGSTDDDGQIQQVRWDFGADGTVEETESVETGIDATATRTYETTGTKQVRVVVVDDDGAESATTVGFTVASGAPTARCTVDPTRVTVGGDVRIDASGSTDATRYQFAPRGESFGDPTQEPVRTAVYREAGTYTPLVRARSASGDRSDTVECPTVDVVREDGTGPTTAGNGTTTVGGATTTDTATPVPDGDGDTGTAAPGPGPGEEGTPAGANAGGDSGGSGGPLPVPVWTLVPVAAAAGVGGGLVLCRALPLLRGLSSGRSAMDRRGSKRSTDRDERDDRRRRPKVRPSRDVDAVDAGSFETPTGGGTVPVRDVGFEPDVLLVTAAAPVAARDDGPGVADGGTPGGASGWSYGVAFRDDDGHIDQEVVAAGARGNGRAGGSVRTGRVLDLRVGGGDGVGSVTGRVVSTSSDGFEFALDASALGHGVTPRRYRVQYQAFDTSPGSAVTIGKLFKLGTTVHRHAED